MPTATERIAIFKSIPNGIYRPGSDTYEVIMDVIEDHISFDEKTSKGIEHFEMKNHSVFNNRGVYIVHPDGSETDISFRKGYPTKNGVHNHEGRRLASAFRKAVLEQTSNYKMANKGDDCARCHGTFHADDMQVDHCVTKFRSLTSEFVSRYGKPLHPLDDNGDMGRKFSEQDAEYCHQWKAFHQDNATYRMLCKTCNMQTKTSD